MAGDALRRLLSAAAAAVLYLVSLMARVWRVVGLLVSPLFFSQLMTRLTCTGTLRLWSRRAVDAPRKVRVGTSFHLQSYDACPRCSALGEGRGEATRRSPAAASTRNPAPMTGRSIVSRDLDSFRAHERDLSSRGARGGEANLNGTAVGAGGELAREYEHVEAQRLSARAGARERRSPGNHPPGRALTSFPLTLFWFLFTARVPVYPHRPFNRPFSPDTRSTGKQRQLNLSTF